MATIPITAPRGASQRAPGTPERPGAKRESRLGQSLAEFALTLPMALLMILFGLDFGRVFLGWVALNQAAREAANYAAMNPAAWTLPYNLSVQAEYARLVTTEASNINCALVTPVPDPSFPSGTAIGAPVVVELDCGFSLITPMIGAITGNPIPVSASSAFPIRSGNIEGVPAPSATPTATPAPTATPKATPKPTAKPTPRPTPKPTKAPARCHPSYDPCLPIVADLDCPDVRAMGLAPVTVIGPDEYRLDGDHDGIGCE